MLLSYDVGILQQMNSDDMNEAITSTGSTGYGERVSPSRSVPPSVAKTAGLFPVAFLSANCMYPTAHTASWQVDLAT